VSYLLQLFTLELNHVIINLYTEAPWELENKMFILDWIDENADVMGPLGAFLGVAVAVALCFIFG
jgi:hypothetical protein